MSIAWKLSIVPLHVANVLNKKNWIAKVKTEMASIEQLLQPFFGQHCIYWKWLHIPQRTPCFGILFESVTFCYFVVDQLLLINESMELTSDIPTNAGKLITLTIESSG